MTRPSVKNFTLLIGIALIAGACSSTPVGTTMTTTATSTVPSTTTATTEPPTTTIVAVGDFTVTVDVSFTYQVDGEGGCATIPYRGVDYGFVAEGEPVVIQNTTTGQTVGSYPLGAGRERSSRYGPDVCRFQVTMSLPTDGTGYRFHLADDVEGFTGTYVAGVNAAFGGQLFYPFGVEVGQGIYLVPPEVYPAAVPIWYSDVARALRSYDARRDDLLIGVGFQPPTGTVLVSPIDGYINVGLARGVDVWNDIYVDENHPSLETKQIVVSGAMSGGADSTPDDASPGLRIIVSSDAITTRGGIRNGSIQPGEAIGTVTSSHNALPIVPGEVELVVILYSYDEEAGSYTRSSEAVTSFFPYLDIEQPVSDWSSGITVVVADDCDVCEEILVWLDSAPDNLPVHITHLEDRVVRYFGIREVPTVIARGPGEFDLVTRSGVDVVEQLDDLIGKACAWVGC